MNIKARILIAAFSFLFVNQTLALGLSPVTCPSPDEIKAQGVDEVQPLMSRLYIIYHRSNYNTDRKWLFGIGLIPGDSVYEALINGNERVKEISVLDDKNSGLECRYYITKGDYTEYVGIAVLSEAGKIPQEFEQYFIEKSHH